MALPLDVAIGGWALAETTLASAIANCPSTLGFLDVASEEEAKAGNMFIDLLEPPENDEEYSVSVNSQTGESEWSALHPYILLGTPGDEVGAVNLFRRSSPNDFGCRGVVQLIFAALPDLTKRITDQQQIFKDQVFTILKELTDRGDSVGFLWFSEIDVQGYFRERPDSVEDLGEVQYVICLIPWGDRTED